MNFIKFFCMGLYILHRILGFYNWHWFGSKIPYKYGFTNKLTTIIKMHNIWEYCIGTYFSYTQDCGMKRAHSPTAHATLRTKLLFNDFASTQMRKHVATTWAQLSYIRLRCSLRFTKQSDNCPLSFQNCSK